MDTRTASADALEVRLMTYEVCPSEEKILPLGFQQGRSEAITVFAYLCPFLKTSYTNIYRCSFFCRIQFSGKDWRIFLRGAYIQDEASS